MTKEEARRIEHENELLKEQNARLIERVSALEATITRWKRSVGVEPGSPQAAGAGQTGKEITVRAVREFTADESFDNETLYQAIKQRLLDDVPALRQLALAKPKPRPRAGRPRKAGRVQA